MKYLVILCFSLLSYSCKRNHVWKGDEYIYSKESFAAQENVSLKVEDSNVMFSIKKSDYFQQIKKIWLSVLVKDINGKYIFSMSDYLVFDAYNIDSEKYYLFKGKTSSGEYFTIPTSIIRRMDIQPEKNYHLNVFLKLKFQYDNDNIFYDVTYHKVPIQ